MDDVRFLPAAYVHPAELNAVLELGLFQPLVSTPWSEFTDEFVF